MSFNTIKTPKIIQFNTNLFDEVGKEAFSYHAQEWKKTQIQIKELKRREEHHRKALVKLTEGDEKEECGIRVARHYRNGSIDYQKIPELKDVNLDDYRKEGSWVWTIKPILNND